MLRELRLWRQPVGLEEFNQLFRGDLALVNEAVAFVPRVNVSEGEKAVRITLELPGVDEKDIQIRLTSEGLSIAGEKKQEPEEKDNSYYRLERSYGAFERVIALPDNVDGEKAEATFKRGVLQVVVPKRAEKTAKSIEIRAE